MIITVDSEKPNCVKLKIKNFLTKPIPSISHSLKFDIGSVISIFPAKLHYRTLEKGNNSFKKATTATTTITIEVLNWSLETCSLSSINKLEVNFVVITNESDSDWGTTNGKKPY